MRTSYAVVVIAAACTVREAPFEPSTVETGQDAPADVGSGTRTDPDAPVDVGSDAPADVGSNTGIRDAGSLDGPVAPDPSWERAIVIEGSDTERFERGARVVMGAGGTAIAVWSGANIWANRFRDGVWGEATVIGPNSGAILSLDVGVDAGGDAIAVWPQLGRVFANRLAAGRWGTTGVISPFDRRAQSPQITMNAAGSAIAVWMEQTGGSQDIWARRFTPPDVWSDGAMIGAGESGPATDPEVAIGDSGRAMAVWVYQSAVYARPLQLDSGRFSETILSATPAFQPNVVVDGIGNAIVVWTQSDRGRLDIGARRFLINDGWTDRVLIESSDLPVESPVRVAGNSRGDAFAVWVQGGRIEAARFTPEGGWELPATLDVGSGAIAPSIAVDGTGGAVAVWGRGNGAGVFASWFRLGRTPGWGPPARLDPEREPSTGGAEVAVDRDGRAVAVWHALSNGQDSVWSARSR